MPDRVKAPLAACLACVCALVVLVVLAYTVGPFERADASLLIHVAVQREAVAGQSLNSLADLGGPGPLLAMLAGVCLLALSWGGKREALAAVAVVAGANLTTQVLKVVLAHPRLQPYVGFGAPWPNAFPSGHATAAASIAAALMLASPSWLRPLALLAGAALALAVGASVVALQWHFASDVVGGYLVAAGWGFAALAALRLARPAEREPEPAAARRFAVSPE